MQVLRLRVPCKCRRQTESALRAALFGSTIPPQRSRFVGSLVSHSNNPGKICTKSILRMERSKHVECTTTQKHDLLWPGQSNVMTVCRGGREGPNGRILKALLASRIGQIFLAAILIIAAGSIVSVLVLLWRVVGRGFSHPADVSLK